MAHAALNKVAQHFKSLHRPGQPLILLNVYDTLSARTVASHPTCHALATASFAIAHLAGVPDPALQLATNLRAIADIAPIARAHDKPLTVDAQDCYGAELPECVRALLALGAVGLNIEDSRRDGTLYPFDESVQRVRDVLSVAAEEGVPDFVVNARCDVLLRGRGSVEDTIRRGRAYLEAGATTVYVLGGQGRGGLSAAEVKTFSEAFGGMLNVGGLYNTKGGLGAREIAELGVARISVGPRLMMSVVERIKADAGLLFGDA